jgi:myo-inositol 2-dehydrogenase/D-chiro-inositol 1-dehydrogenase
MRKFGVAMVGTGYMARKHCSALVSHDRAELVTVCATARSRTTANLLKEEFGFAKCVSDFDDVLQDPKVDIVFVCSPDTRHSEQVSRALRAQKHVFCEKPLARTGTEFAEIHKELVISNRVLQVGMNCRFRENYAILKKKVDSGELGTLHYIRGTYIYNLVHSVRAHEKSWSLSYPPGIFPVLHGSGIHVLDLLRWIGGEVKTVYARAKAFELSDAYGADTFSISIEFSGGAMGEMLVSGSAFRPNDFSLEIWLSAGSIVGIDVFRREGDSLLADPERLVIEQEALDLELQYNDLVSAIENNHEPLNTFSEAYRNFKVIAAIEESIRSGQPVDVIEVQGC